MRIQSKNVFCDHGSNAPVDRVTSSYYGGSLTVDQSDPSRHGCPVCAYARGWEDGQKELKERLFNRLFEGL